MGGDTQADYAMMHASDMPNASSPKPDVEARPMVVPKATPKVVVPPPGKANVVPRGIAALAMEQPDELHIHNNEGLIVCFREKGNTTLL